MYKDARLAGTNFRTELIKTSDLENLKKSFIETLTHDLKTPILAQMRVLELMLAENFGKFNNEQSQMLELTLESCKYMYGMVSTLISTYRYECEEFSLNYSYFNIIECIEKSLENLQSFLTEKNIKIVVIPDLENNLISGDLIRIKKVIETLIFTSVNMAFKNSIVKIYIEENCHNLVFKIQSYSGCTSQAKMENLFELYTPYMEKFDKIGTGIGLFLVKKIVEKHQGQIIVQCDLKQKNILGFEIPKEIYFEKCS